LRAANAQLSVCIKFSTAIAKPNEFWREWSNIHIEKLPEGCYLATSDGIQGFVAQGSETLEIAKGVAKKVIESRDACS
jgi:hypothetical protein